MDKISAILGVLLLLAGTTGLTLATEGGQPTPAEFRDLVRQYQEAGKQPVGKRLRPAVNQQGVEQFNRAVTLQSKKGASAGDLKEAARLYQAAAAAGIPQASTNLALLYLEGKGVKKDVKRAIALLNNASGKYDIQADLVLARLYLLGKEVKGDEKKGEWHLNRAARAGNQNAIKALAEYREWKKNEMALKEYQELMKKVQQNQFKPQTTTPLPPTTAPEQTADSPLKPQPSAPQFPVIPGQLFLGGKSSFSSALPMPQARPVVNKVPTGDSALPQPAK